MKSYTLTLTLLFTALFIISCEGPKYFNITVVDKTTQQPIDSVFVKVVVKAGKIEKSAYNLEGYTDSAGKFIREEMIGYGLSLRPWDFFMEYNKEGYAPKIEMNRTEGTVELER